MLWCRSLHRVCAACNELSDFSSSGAAEVNYAVIAAICTLHIGTCKNSSNTENFPPNYHRPPSVRRHPPWPGSKYYRHSHLGTDRILIWVQCCKQCIHKDCVLPQASHSITYQGHITHVTSAFTAQRVSHSISFPDPCSAAWDLGRRKGSKFKLSEIWEGAKVRACVTVFSFSIRGRDSRGFDTGFQATHPGLLSLLRVMCVCVCMCSLARDPWLAVTIKLSAFHWRRYWTSTCTWA